MSLILPVEFSWVNHLISLNIISSYLQNNIIISQCYQVKIENICETILQTSSYSTNISYYCQFVFYTAVPKVLSGSPGGTETRLALQQPNYFYNKTKVLFNLFTLIVSNVQGSFPEAKWYIMTLSLYQLMEWCAYTHLYFPECSKANFGVLNNY